MIFPIVILSAIFLLSFWLGFRQKYTLQDLTKKRIANALLALLILLTLMAVANVMQLLPQVYAAYITMGLYNFVAGFCGGSGFKLMRMNRKAGRLEYMHQSFWSRLAPNMMITAVVALGIYQTGLFSWHFTAMGISSGLSLICFGFWGWTLNIVPQFRSHKILFLDRSIDWDDIASYRWLTEESLHIDYHNDAGLLAGFTTYIPPVDQLAVERLLSDKVREDEPDPDFM